MWKNISISAKIYPDEKFSVECRVNGAIIIPRNRMFGITVDFPYFKSTQLAYVLQQRVKLNTPPNSNKSTSNESPVSLQRNV